MTKLASISLFAVLFAAAVACGDKKPANNPTSSSDSGSSSDDGGSSSSSDDAGGATASGDGGGGTAEKPAPKKDCHKDMWGKYKAEGFAKVVDNILAKAIAAPDDKIGKSFAKLKKDKKAQEKFKTNLTAFLAKVYGGEDKYKGKEMGPAHKGMKITSDQYDYFVSDIIVPSLKDAGVSEDDISNCFAPPVKDDALKSSIVEAAPAKPTGGDKKTPPKK